MNQVEEVMAELKKKGSEQTLKTLRRHGVTGDLFGVKIGDLKPIAKSIKGDQELAYQLYSTGNYVIAVGTYVKPLLRQAKQAAKSIGTVTVDMGDTACKVPLATAYIAKVEKMGRVGKKRKTMKC